MVSTGIFPEHLSCLHVQIIKFKRNIAKVNFVCLQDLSSAAKSVFALLSTALKDCVAPRANVRKEDEVITTTTSMGT